jgi:hypothetical protein
VTFANLGMDSFLGFSLIDYPPYAFHKMIASKNRFLSFVNKEQKKEAVCKSVSEIGRRRNVAQMVLLGNKKDSYLKRTSGEGLVVISYA